MNAILLGLAIYAAVCFTMPWLGVPVMFVIGIVCGIAGFFGARLIEDILS